MVRINWTKQSVMDLKNIYEYISNDSVKFAKIQIIKVKMRTKILKQNPQAGKMVIELDKANIRELVEG
ncbi:MAG: type II toxin-antitoxin system RelE/ParE family toxin, partial [Cytophagales bacterium]